MSNPFKKITANAAASKSLINSKGESTATTVATRACETCGAPRPKNTNLATCDYRKHPFMGHATHIKSDS